MERQTYELSLEQEAFLQRAIEHPPIAIPGKPVESAQSAADAAWQRLADDLGFDWTTVEPLDPEDRRRFTAVPRI